MQFTPSFVIIAGGRTPQVHACLPSCLSNSRVHWPKPLRHQPLHQPRPWRRRIEVRPSCIEPKLEGQKDQKRSDLYRMIFLVLAWGWRSFDCRSSMIKQLFFVEHVFGDPCTWQGQGGWVWGAMAKPTSIAKERQCQPSEMSLGCMAPDIWSSSTNVFIVKTIGFEISCQPNWLAFRRLGFKCLKWLMYIDVYNLPSQVHVSSQNIEHRFFLASFYNFIHVGLISSSICNHWRRVFAVHIPWGKHQGVQTEPLPPEIEVGWFFLRA